MNLTSAVQKAAEKVKGSKSEPESELDPLQLAVEEFQGAKDSKSQAEALKAFVQLASKSED